MEASLKFADQGTSELADDVFSLFAQSILRTFSVGFRVFEMERDRNPDGSDKPPRVVDAELFEVSAVSVPANPNAVAKRLRQDGLLRGEQALTSSTKMLATDHASLMRRATQVLNRVSRKQAEGKVCSQEELEALAELRLASIIATRPSATDRDAVTALADLSAHLDQTVAKLRWGTLAG